MTGETLAERTRAAVRARPFLLEALRAGVCNYTATARFLDIGEEGAVAAALRRFADDLGAHAPPAADARVRMQSGFGEGPAAEAVLAVGETSLVPEAGSLTVVLATGALEPAVLRVVLGRLAAGEVPVEAAAVDDATLAVAVPRRAGPDALRVVEAAVQRD